MQIEDISSDPQIQSLEADFAVRGLDFNSALNTAFNDVSSAPFVSNDKDAWIKAIAWKLEGVLADKIEAKPATTRVGRWIRAILPFLSIFKSK